MIEKKPTHSLENEIVTYFGQNTIQFFERDSSDFLWIWNLEQLNEGWFSSKLWCFLGYKLNCTNQVLPNLKTIIIPNDYTMLRVALSNVTNTPSKNFEQTIRFKHRDGSIRWLNLQGTITKNQDGSPMRVIGVCYDTSRLEKLALSNIQESTRLNQVINVNGIGIWDWQDIKKPDVFWSESFYNLLGYKDQECKMTFELFIAFLHPEDTPRVIQAINQNLSNNTLYNIEYRLQKKDKTYSWFNATGESIRDCNNNPVRMLGSIINIDKKKQNESKIEKEQERFQLAVTGASVGIWDWVDVNNSYQYWSPKFYSLLGYDINEVESTFENFVTFLHIDDQQNLFNALDKHFENNTPFELEYRLVCKDGSIRWFRGAGISSRTKNRQPVRMVGSIEDIHLQKTAENELKVTLEKLTDSNANLEQFAYAASHDLQEPIRTIASYLRLIERRYLSDLPEEALEFFQIVTEGCLRMKALINDLLQFSKVNADYEPQETINLKLLIESIVNRTLKQNTNVDITFECSNELYIHGIKSYLDRLFVNLFSNSIKYQPQGQAPKIHIKAQLDSGNIQITLADNGIGIDSQFYDKIFEVFQRLHALGSYHGTGIGLALCKKITTLHKGTISVQSKLGEGSCFTLNFPNCDTEHKKSGAN
ncbi:hypothetical protein AMS58_06220 [Pseudoalteromonas porphyrae]|nr:hypothetical protein AMS58_06220 [Pseudoalteromonas porphyrae]